MKSLERSKNNNGLGPITFRLLPYMFLCLIILCSTSKADDIHVFIVAGQSNAVGYGSDAGDLPPEFAVPQTDILFWYEEGPWNSITDRSLRIHSDSSFTDLQYQTDLSGATFGGLIDGFGPEISLGRTLADSLESSIAIVKFAINASSLGNDWHPTSPGPLYTDLVTIVNDALIELGNLGHTGEIAGFFWMQGEWDAIDVGLGNDYEANLTNFIQALRAEFGNSSMPFVLGRLHADIDDAPYCDFPALATVRDAQRSVANNLPDVYMVNTDDLSLNSDILHFTADAQLMLGLRFAMTYLNQQSVAISLSSNWVKLFIIIIAVLTAVIFLRFHRRLTN